MKLLYKLLWLVYLPAYVICLLFSVILSPVYSLGIFTETREGALDNNNSSGPGLRLWKSLAVFDTWDNALPDSYIARVKWFLRNPAYGFAWNVFCIVNSGDGFQLEFSVGSVKCRIGWLLSNPQFNSCMYLCSVRIKK